MGWWSTGIMGGDTPLDFEDEFYGICDIEKFEEDSINSIPKGVLAEKLPEILEYIQKTGDDMGIGYQVLGVLMMDSGAEISMELKAAMIQSADNDDWASENTERADIMKQFVNSLNVYNGSTRIKITTPGLFETIAKHIADGKTGLVNL